MSEVMRVAIDKVCWEAKMKDWDDVNAFNVWDNVQNDFNIKYMADNEWGELSQKTVYNCMSSSNIFQNPNNAL